MSRAIYFVLNFARAISFCLFVTMSIPSAFAQTEVPGSISGDFAVNQTGSATYSIPIKIPPGTGGMQPSISLQYSSSAGQSEVGYGWGLSGYSEIKRGKRQIDIDGSAAGVNFTQDDAFYLDGKRIVPVRQLSGNKIEYKTIINDYSRIIASGITDNGPTSFTVQTKAGLTIEFGQSKNSRLEVNNTPIVWAQSRITDTLGNYIAFDYENNGQGHQYLKRISYTGNSNIDAEGKPLLNPYTFVDFNYRELGSGNKYKPSSYYRYGQKFVQNKQLSSISVTSHNQIFRQYNLSQSDGSVDQEFRLSTIVESGRDGIKYRPTRFSYSQNNAVNAWQNDTGYAPDDLPFFSEGSSFSQNAYRVQDINSDGYPDLLYSEYSENAIEGYYLQGTSEKWEKVSGAELPFSLEGTDKVVFEDLDGDNVLEAINLQNSNKGIYSLSDDGWTINAGLNPIPPLITTETVLFIDANGDDIPDLLTLNSTRAQTYLQSDDGWELSDRHRIQGKDFRILDTNCDGVDEIATWEISDQNIKLSIFESDSDSWDKVSNSKRTEIELEGTKKILFDNLNNDDCLDLIVIAEQEKEEEEEEEKLTERKAFLFLATSSGWEFKSTASESFPIDQHATIGMSTFLEFTQLKEGTEYKELIVHKFDGYQKTFQFISGEWKEIEFIIPPKLSSISERENFKITDLNNDGMDDLVFLSAANSSVGLQVFTNNGTAWVPNENKRVPPVHLAQWKKFERHNLFVDLNGDGLLDLIDDKKAWMNSGSGWKENKLRTDGTNTLKYTSPIALKAGDGGDNGVRLSDLNGDGRTDFIYSVRKSNGSVSYGAFLNDPIVKDWVKTDAFDEVLKLHPFAHEKNGWLGSSIIDLNGDGLPDLLVSYRSSADSSLQKAFINTGGSWEENSSFIPCIDRLCVDFAYASASDPNYKPSTIRRGFGYITIKEPYPVNKSTSATFLDLNGDGLPDILFNHLLINMPVTKGSKNVTSKTRTEKGALINTGSGWIRDDSFAKNLIHQLDENPKGITNPDKNYQTNYYTDINSDQLLDIVILEKNKKEKTSTIYLNTGAGFTTNSTSWKIPSELFTDKTEATGFQFMDLNHDGRVDILQHLQDKNGKTKKNNAWINTGDSFHKNDNYKSPFPLGIETQGDVGFRFMDLNGDGFDDLLQSFKNKSGTISKGVWLNKNKRPGLITEVTDGLGNEIFVNYNSMISGSGQTGPPGYSKDPKKSSYPEVWAMAPRYLVESSGLRIPGYEALAKEDPTKVEYKYGGFKINLRTGEPLGFEIRQERNRQQNTIHTEFYHQSSWLAGKTLRTTDVYINESGQQVLLSDKRLNWARPVERMGEVVFGKTFAYWHNQLTGAETRKYDETGNKSANKTEKIVYAIETGDVVKTEVSIADTKTTVTQNEYFSPDWTNWILGRLQKSTVTISRPTGSSQFTGDTESKSSCFEYDSNNGLLTKEVAYCGHNMATTTTYSYDSFGNKVETVLSGNDFDPRSSRVVYDKKTHRLVVRSSNALNWESTTQYDEVMLTALSTTDVNGLTTSFQYDGFGTLLSTTDPLGVVSKTALKFFKGNDTRSSQISHYSETQTGDLPPDFSYFDAANREIISKSTGFKGRVVRIEREYNTKGQMVAESTPYYEDDLSKQFWSKIEYDNLGRATKQIAPDESITQIVYAGKTTTTINAENKTKSITVDDNEKPILVIDAMGGELRYEYDVADRLVKTTNVDGSVIHHYYNDLGQKVKTDDPALGTWTYKYNSIGELLEQNDAKAQRTTISYDILGRAQSKSIYYDNGTLYQKTKWEYDTALMGSSGRVLLGGLAKLSDNSGYAEEYKFDEYSRAIGSSINVRNYFITDAPGPYDTNLELDNFGRVVQLTYPTGFAIKNMYDKEGFQTAVVDAKTMQPYWEAGEYDYAGRLIREKYGNGVSQTQVYDNQSGYLTRKFATGSSDGVVTDQSYEYDLVGNLLKKTDRPHNRTHRYGYDELERLNAVSATGLDDISVSYAANGNILSKSGVGNYAYAARGPVGAIAMLTSPTGVEHSYVYDANGNMTESQKGNIVYTPDNLVSSIRKRNRVRSSFLYSPNGNKYFHDYYDERKHIKTVYAGMYERIYEQGVAPFFPTQERIRHRHYISSPGGTVGIVEDVIALYPKRRSLDFQRITTAKKPDFTSDTNRRVQYFHTDKLGSIVALTSDQATVLERMEYDAWGKRLNKPQTAFLTYRRGFTGHEHLDNLELIHMNGRVYDPDLGRFLSADPFVQNQSSSQNHNRYTYVNNNPLKYTDPSGFFLKKAFKKFTRAISKPFKELRRFTKRVGKEIGRAIKNVGEFFEENWREIVVTAVAIAITVATGGIGGAILAGFVSGGLSSALYGGDFSDVLEAGLKGAVIAGVTAGATQAWGGSTGIAKGMGLSQQSFGRAVGHGVIGGAVSELQGGDFMQGFGSAAFTKFASANINVNGISGFEGEQFARVSVDAAIGGTASVIGGGKFSNGAITSAMQSQFNREAGRKTMMQKIADAFTQDGHLSFMDAKSIYNYNFYLNDPELIVNVDINKIPMEIKSQVLVYSNRFIASPSKLSDWVVHGDITVRQVAPNLFRGLNDTYDFDIRREDGFTKRNIGTAMGQMINGLGRKYDIRFNGETRQRLPW